MPIASIRLPLTQQHQWHPLDPRPLQSPLHIRPPRGYEYLSQVPGHPALPIDRTTGDVISSTYQEPGSRLRLSMPTSASIAGAVNKVFSTVSRGVKFVLARPVTLLALGGAAVVLYRNWDTIGWYFYKVMEHSIGSKPERHMRKRLERAKRT